MRLCVLRLIQEAKHSALSSINSNPKKKDHFGQKKCYKTNLSQYDTYSIIIQQLKANYYTSNRIYSNKKGKKIALG